MKRLLIIYTKMVIGGSTTSLLSLLDVLDYSEIAVDLQLYEYGGELFQHIPKQVNILPLNNENIRYGKYLGMKRLFTPKYIIDFIKSRLLAYLNKNPLIKQQIMTYSNVSLIKEYPKSYEVAIGFLEFWPTVYLAEKVKAQKKVSWIHIDYIGTRLLKKYDLDCFDKIDFFVFVSMACKDNFKATFPNLSSKIKHVENIQNANYILEMSNQPIEDDYFVDIISEAEKMEKIIFVTTCRIVEAKGIQRGIKAFANITKKFELNNYTWIILGDGEYIEVLQNLVKSLNLEGVIFFAGNRINPFPFLLKANFFLLPSYYEGKPMSVTEAMILGVVPVVTEYDSARKQLKDGQNGIIIDNNDIALEEGLIKILKKEVNITLLKKSIEKTGFSNNEALVFIESLFNK